MYIKSSAFGLGESIPSIYTCDGEDISPPFEIGDVPTTARSLALVVEDPDAPSGKWLHWTLWNIQPNIRLVPQGQIPAGTIEGITHFGIIGYGGPCPGEGNHRYVFILYALNIGLDLASGAEESILNNAMSGHILSEAHYMGRYEKKK